MAIAKRPRRGPSHLPSLLSPTPGRLSLPSRSPRQWTLSRLRRLPPPLPPRRLLPVRLCHSLLYSHDVLTSSIQPLLLRSRPSRRLCPKVRTLRAIQSGCTDSESFVANASFPEPQRSRRYPPLSHLAVSAMPPKRALPASPVSTRAPLLPRKRSLMPSRPSRQPSCPTRRERSAQLPETSRHTTRRTTLAVFPTTTTASNMANTSSSSASRTLRSLLSRRSLSALSAATRTRLRPTT